MSVMTRPGRPAEKAPSSVIERRMAQPAEAPDCGVAKAQRESREAGRLKIAEAPDAGEGRSALLDSEFTHGRSQS